MLPLAGKVVDDGSGETDEEQKLRNESRKILEIPDLAGLGDVRAGAGVHRALAVAQRWSSTGRSASPRRRSCWPAPPASSWPTMPTPLEAAGQDPCYVGRIRQDPTVADGRGLVLFVSNDNLRKGAALNAIQIAEELAPPPVLTRELTRRAATARRRTAGVSP